ncbi:MAG: succinate--CoA ligase subunit beta [Granulosicoccus sp.]|nr:succinate--CoA ligase subunit beta [Granulosicoccus sp.]
MNLNEFQSKKLLQTLGFKIPDGVVCESAVAAEVQVEGVLSPPWVVKAQIPAGGRAKGRLLVAAQPQVDEPSGGIRFADSVPELTTLISAMLGAVLVTAQTGVRGARVSAVYVESRVDVLREHYLALTVDPDTGGLVFVVSRHGGTEFEDIARQSPETLHRFPVALEPPHANYAAIADALDLDQERRAMLLPALAAMVNTFIERDVLLLEINPLAEAADGSLVALDAAVVYDDNALFRQGHPEQMVAYDHLPDREYEAMVQGLNYVKLEGSIATLSAGAGLAMATMDAIHTSGGAPANFLDVPPSTSVEHIRNALDLLLRDSDARCLLVNVFGGGIMRCDAVADAVLLAAAGRTLPIPLVVRLAGTNAELGRQRLRASMPGIVVTADLADAVAFAVELASNAGASRTMESASWWERVRRLLPDSVGSG